MGFSTEQRRNAGVIISVGRSLGASDRDILIALMTAMQESTMRNLNYGDRDSIGMFQQRNAWGSRQARLDPYQSTRMFFLGGRGGQPGLFDKRNRNRMSLTQAAQAVQVSAFPNAYAKWEDEARLLMGGAASKVTGRSGGQGGGGGWVRPVRNGQITHAYGTKDRPGGARHARGYDTGTDYGVPIGTPVYAASAGRVVYAGGGGAYGTRIEIEHGGKIWTLYAHLSRAQVKVGDQVSAGQVIGLSGNSGNSTGPHLHFEVRKGQNRYGYDVNPADYLNGNTTPSAYVGDSYSEMTTTRPANVMDYLNQQVDQAIGMATPKPYVYISPIDMMTAPTVPLTTEDPLAAFGIGAEPEEESPSSVAAEAGPLKAADDLTKELV